MVKSTEAANRKFLTRTVHTWEQLVECVREARNTLGRDDSEELWFRGVSDRNYPLLPTLMRDTGKVSRQKHDEIEQDLFFEFQAKSHDLRSRNLSEWEVLFFGRHHGIPTRLIDWTDTLGVAVYFALERFQEARLGVGKQPDASPAIWILNPYALNKKTWGFLDIVLPRYLGLDDDGDYWDFGELLIADGPWAWDGPVAIYPTQLAERVRAQRGWFTIHGNRRDALEVQYPNLVWKIVLSEDFIPLGLNFLDSAGFNKFSIYPDFDNLAMWLRQKALKHLADIPRNKGNKKAKQRKPRKGR